jgi:hypothetical protein
MLEPITLWSAQNWVLLTYFDRLDRGKNFNIFFKFHVRNKLILITSGAFMTKNENKKFFDIRYFYLHFGHKNVNTTYYAILDKNIVYLNLFFSTNKTSCFYKIQIIYAVVL